MSQVIVNGIKLLDGQQKAVRVALARLAADLSFEDEEELSDAERALLKMTREVMELLRCDGG